MRWPIGVVNNMYYGSKKVYWSKGERDPYSFYPEKKITLDMGLRFTSPKGVALCHYGLCDMIMPLCSACYVTKLA